MVNAVLVSGDVMELFVVAAVAEFADAAVVIVTVCVAELEMEWEVGAVTASGPVFAAMVADAAIVDAMTEVGVDAVIVLHFLFGFLVL